MICLIGCGKEKREAKTDDEKLYGFRAEDLYTGGLFRARATYARGAANAWWIVSAKCGLLKPDQLVRPYDKTMSDLDAVDRAAWALAVPLELVSQLWPVDEPYTGAPLRECRIEIHAGADYAEPLRDVLRAVGFSPSWPVEGLGVGEQLAWYKQRNDRIARGLPWDM